MTNKEILEYNKRCVEFLGYVNTTLTDKDFNIYYNEKGMIIGNKIHTMIEPMSAEFHSDWNWIMEVVEAIEKLGYKFQLGWNITALISLVPNTPAKIALIESENRKEAVVQAIDSFLKFYNKNKTI